MVIQSSQNANKPVCQFYQKGNCKYGNKCWNLHPGASGNVFGWSSSSSPSSSVGFSNFGNNSNSAPEKQFEEFVEQVSSEMTVWEKSGLWLLSCLAPLKEHPPLVAFTDTTFEELRLEAYEALKANNPAAYQTSVNQKLEYHKHLRQALKNQLPEAIEVLKTVFFKANSTNSSTSGASSSTASLFGNPSGPFLGATPSTQPSLFGGSSSNTQLNIAFGGTANVGANNIFGSKPPQNSAFGTAPVFGSSASKGFGEGSAFKSKFTPQSSSNLFGGVVPNESTSNVFRSTSQNQATQGTTLFGGNAQQLGPSSNVFGCVASPNKGSSNLFGSGTQNAGTPPLFGGTTQQGLGVSGTFGSSTSGFGTSNIYNNNTTTTQQTSSTVFGGTNQTTGAPKLFGNISQPQGNNQTNIFTGGSSGQNTNVFGGNQNQTGNSSGGISNSNFSMTQQQNSSILFGNNNNCNDDNNNSGATSNIFGKSSFPPQNNTSNILASGSSKEREKSDSITMADAVPSTAGLSSQTPSSSGGWFATGSSNATQPGTQLGSQVESNQPSVFGSQSAHRADELKSINTSSSGGTQNVFGVPHNSEGSTSSNAPTVSSSANQIYTPFHLLSLDDRTEFERETFQRIPLVPPPKELCV